MHQTLAARPCSAARQAFASESGRTRRPSTPAAGRPASRGAVTVLASAGEGGLTSSNSSLLGPSLGGGASPSLGPQLGQQQSSKPAVKLEDVPLESGAGLDYSELRDLLAAGKWREAEDETRAKLIEAAGPAAIKRNWVYFTEVKDIADSDLAALDGLWAAASGGKFGYSTQRELWLQKRRQWDKFFKAIDWVQGENNIYRKWPGEFDYSLSAPKGHLPLTNALRGTRLFEAILEHPAIAGKKAGAAGDDDAASGGAAQPSWLNK